MEKTSCLDAPIQYIKGVGPALSKILSKKGIRTLEDALYFLPRAYEDRSCIRSIGELRPGESAAVLVKVLSQRSHRKGRRNLFEATVTDGTGTLILNWFFAFPSLKADFTVGRSLLLYGDLRFYRGQLGMNHPEYEPVEDTVDGKPRASLHFGRVVPVYSETEGLKQKTLRRLMGEVLKSTLSHLSEPLPPDLLGRHHLPSLRESFLSVHFPQKCPPEGKSPPGVRRIIFEEFFVLQLGLGLRRRQLQQEPSPPLKDGRGWLEKYLDQLPFKMTEDQQASVKSLAGDLEKGNATARLIQGDVGSGKTVVAFAGSVIAASCGFQSALMAPTEILAQQHFKSAVQFLEPLGIEVVLLTHSVEKKAVLEKIRSGEALVVVGTHALFQDGVEFSRLGLVIVDEQHRFGVEQRNRLMKKNLDAIPHLLMMTATPIPRTLSLTLYGDLDLTLIRQKPPGRQPVKTTIMKEAQKSELHGKIRSTLESGQQAYIIYPLVENSEKLELKSATEMFERLQKEVFPDFSVGLLHGKMKSEEKDKILRDFKEGVYRLLVSTTVIEVGIDVPNATLMVIEHAERLGLSQLHQLRGRVGRGSESSQCILVSGQFVSQRLRIMTRTDDGFVIAEEDLKLRGPGEFLGTRQHGLPGFRVGNILEDFDLLEMAKVEAESLLNSDPELSQAKNKDIRKMVETRWKGKLERLSGG